MLEASGWTPESFSIVVPVFNEEENTEIYELGVDHEFLYLVSPESASLADRIRDLQCKDPKRVRVNRTGYSASGAATLSAGIKEIEGEALSISFPSALLFVLGVQLFTIGFLGGLILFSQVRDIRDYRIAALHEVDESMPLESCGSTS